MMITNFGTKPIFTEEKKSELSKPVPHEIPLKQLEDLRRNR